MNKSRSLDNFVKTDDAIFHYTKASIALEKILFEGKFRLSLLKDTNDPWEYKIKLFSMSAWSLPLDKMVKSYKEANAILDRIIGMEIKVMCFCSNILDSGKTIPNTVVTSIGPNKSRMWAQYGEDHRGICLVFSKEAIKAEFANIKKMVITQNIKYTTMVSVPKHSPYMLNGNNLDKDGVENYCYNHIKQYSNDLFFIKHIDYRDENEYRVVVFDPKQQYEHNWY